MTDCNLSAPAGDPSGMSLLAMREDERATYLDFRACARGLVAAVQAFKPLQLNYQGLLARFEQGKAAAAELEEARDALRPALLRWEECAHAYQASLQRLCEVIAPGKLA